MAELPSADELTRVGQAALRTALDPEGRGTVDLRAGSRLDALVGLGAALGTRLSAYAADRVGAARLESATGEDLDELARDIWTEARKAAAFATGQRRFTRGAGLPATTLPKGTRVAMPATATAAAVVFEVTETLAVGANETTVDAPLRAVESGPAGNLTDPSLVSRILDPLPTTSPASTWTLASTPGAVFGGGADVESDEALKYRLGQYDPVAARVRGTRDAVLAGALRVPGVRWVTAVELNGSIALFVGDEGFALPAALKSAVETELLNWRCYGVPVGVFPFTVTTVNVVATLHLARALANYDLAAVRAAAVAAVKLYFDARPHPDEYFVNAIEAALFRAHDEVQQVVLSAPGTNALRPGDYDVATSAVRFVVSDASIRLTLAAPLTA